MTSRWRAPARTVMKPRGNVSSPSTGRSCTAQRRQSIQPEAGASWLRAVLAQRHVDGIRARRRTEPLPDDESLLPSRVEPQPIDAERARYLQVMQHALATAIAALAPRDRLRLKCYYVQNMKLAAIGTLLREHEATVSRHLTRTRGAVREVVERYLREDHGLSDTAIVECFRSVTTDPGTIDLRACLAEASAKAGKIVGLDRSDLERI